MDDVVEQGFDDVIKMGDSGTRLPESGLDDSVGSAPGSTPGLPTPAILIGAQA